MPTEIAQDEVAQHQEAEHLENTLSVIARRLERLQKERGKSKAELVQYRKYMWEDAAFFDRAERAQSENAALIQEKGVMDVAVRLKRMSLLSASPYFGRIDFEEKEVESSKFKVESCPEGSPASTRDKGRPGQSPATTSDELASGIIYIGLYGLFGDDHSILIYDWRAPVSGMFYDSEVGPASYVAPEGKISGDILLKRQYKIENGRMVYMLDSSLAINDEILREALARNTTEKMRQIVNSIQQEQNRLIRDESRKVLVVQGPAGSGKTSIAMHRAAYLLYRHRGHIAANNLLIFSPNEVFADYISNVLPELGEENIREATFEDYARSMMGKKVTIEPKAEQMEFILSRAPSPPGEGGRNLSPGPSPRKGGEYEIRAASIAFKSSLAFLEIIRNYERDLRNTLRFEDIVLNNTKLLSGSTVEALYWEHCSELPIMRGIERLKDRVLANCTYSSEFVERKIEKLVECVLPIRDPVRLYKKLFSDFHRMKRLADDGHALPDNLHLICRHTTRSISSKRIPYEDAAPMVLLRRLIEGEPRYVNVKHLIIDEAQDYTPIHFEIIRQLFGDSSITILGDLSQRINPYSGLDSYEPLAGILGADARIVAELTKSYRSSWEITEFARGVLPTATIADNIRRSNRKPTVVKADSQEHIARLISDEMTRLQDEGMVSIAVICKTAHEAARVYSKLHDKHDVRLVEADSITFHHGLVVLPVYLAKGLEFDAVIIHDVSSDYYGSDTERKILYTACTRALHSLTLYYAGELSPLVPNERPLQAALG